MHFFSVMIKQGMKTKLKLEEIEAEVIQKKINNLHLRVLPPDGTVRISAPFHTKNEIIHDFAFSRLNWIRKQRLRISKNVLESYKYINLEIHYYMGCGYQLKVQAKNEHPFVQLTDNEILLHVPEGADEDKRRSVLHEWYHSQLTKIISPLVKKWETILNVSVERFSIRSMKTRWGSCTPKTRKIRFNLELVKRSHACLEYIVVHEMVHLLEASHNNKFKALMDRFYPNWKLYRKELRSLPIKA